MTPWLSALHWAHPWAWTAALAPLARHAWRRRTRRSGPAAAYADAALRPWAVREAAGAGGARALLEALIWLLLVAALAGPRLLRETAAPDAASGAHRVALMVLLELPDSGGDAALQARRAALRALQQRLHGERLGLMVFGHGVTLLLPCTRDRALFDSFLDRARPALLRGVAGPGLAGALALARRALLREPGPSRAIVLLASASATRAAGHAERTALRRQRHALHAARIPLFLAWSGAAEPGPLLRGLVARSGGAWAPLARGGVWDALYDGGIARLPPDPPRVGQRLAWRPLDGVPLLGALALLLVLAGGAPWRARRNAAPMLPALLLGVALGAGALLAPPARADAARGRWQAWQAWERGDDRACARLYAALHGADARIGEGDCDARGGHDAQALDAFRRAVLRASDDHERAIALYDLGNAAFHIPGRLRMALDAYRASLVLAPGNPATLRNLRLAREQWAQDHPPRACADLRKRGAPQSAARFGDTADTAPSQSRHTLRWRGWRTRDQRLAAGGALQARAAQGADGGRRPLWPAIDLAAARRAMQLLHDDRERLLLGLAAADSRDAAARVAQR